jgi:predicted O-linked N-acetylglucosamine transferase (SPINDLY family)
MSRRPSRVAARPRPVTPSRRPGCAPSPTALQEAWALYARGDRTKAESLCRSILSRSTDDLAAMTLLGILLAQRGRAREAADLLGRVADRTPEDATAHNNYGNVLRDLGRYGKALACYDRAIALESDCADAHYNRGVTLQDLRRYAEALTSYDRAVQLSAEHASAWNNRGVTLRVLGRPEEAVASHERAIAIRPGYAEAHNNRGVGLQDLARLEDALAAYDRAVALQPSYPEAHNNRGVALLKLERFTEALESFDRAVASRPDYAEAHNNRGVALKKLERYEEALQSFDNAISAKPDYAEAYSNRGSTLRALKRYEEALRSLQQALSLDPYCFDAHRHLGTVFLELKSHEEALVWYERALVMRKDAATYAAQGAVLVNLKRIGEAAESYRHAVALAPEEGFLLGMARYVRMQICDWTDFDGDVARIVAGLEADRPVARPFNVMSLIDSPGLQRKAAEISTRAEFSPRRALPAMTRHPRHDRIRIGYFSADLCNHAVTILTAELFETHDRSRFETTAFLLGANVRDAFRARVEAAFDRFLWVGAQPDREIAELARGLEIDIAVDLGGYTGDARPGIMALRAAPVQVSYLGYLGTMGAEFMDYLIADPVIVPPESRGDYTEKIAYLPSYQVNDSKRVIADKVFTRAELGLPESGFVYCCFNASYKITPETFASWMRILTAAPGSVLFLLGGDAAVEHNLRQQALSRGVSPERLVFAARVGNAEYLARYRAADLFLDTLPYNAGTTASDALWAGLPVLTRAGRSFAARVAASLLTAVGLPELIAHDETHYERLAVELANDPARTSAIRRKLAANRSTCALFDTPTFTRNIEALYERMYERHQSGLSPEHLELR